MLEMGTSGLMSGDGKRGGFNVSTRVRPRLYNRSAASSPASAFLNDAGVGSNSVALHFCFNPPRDDLGNLRLFSHVLVVTICDHGGIYPGWTMG